MSVCQPHRALVILCKEFWDLFLGEGGEGGGEEMGEGADGTLVLQSAWRILNITLFYSPALMCGYIELTCAALGLALDARRGNSSNEERGCVSNDHEHACC